MSKPIVFTLSKTERISVSPGRIESSLFRSDDRHDEAYNGACDGIEALLLALVTRGVNLDTKAARLAVQDAVESIANIT